MRQDVQDFILELFKQNNIPGTIISHNNIRSQCPYHRKGETQLKTRTFSISFTREDKGFPFKCFSCGQKGNIISLIMYLNQCSYKKAEKIFLKKVALTPISISYLQDSFNTMTKDIVQTLEHKPLADLPPKFSSKPMLEYLKKRNSLEQHNIMNLPYIVSRYGLYYCDTGRYAKRIIMPIKDFHGRVVYFTNRSIFHDSDRKNLFPAGGSSADFVYGIYEAMGRAENGLICEGPFEVFQLESFILKYKIKNWAAVSLLGTELSEQKATLISAIFKRAYILFDNEPETFKKDPKTFKNKEEKAFEVLSDFMPVFKMTKQLYEGKEPATSNEKQLRKLFRFKHKRQLNMVDRAVQWW